MKHLNVIIFLFFISMSLSAQIGHALRDQNGRHVIGRGFVVVTNNSYFSSDDYTRMARLGANHQVVRLELGKLSDFPGASLDDHYLHKLDTLIRLGSQVGIKTIFKMTMYGIEDFSWEKFWTNEKNMHETYLNAWKVVWKRYKDNDNVIGYDLVNEPRKLSMDISYTDLTDKYLIPLYKRIIDESQKINPEKYCLVQSIFMNKGHKINGNQYAEITTPLDRENILFAPHIYQEKKNLVASTLRQFEKESKLLDAPVFIGEWGFPTFDVTDSTMTGKLGQLNYMDFYIRTAELFDSLGMNTIKAWFSGNPNKQNFLPGGPSTWAIFEDKNAVGTVERKYITDIIARPYPQAIAGDIQSFKYDFATRSLDLFIKTDNSKGTSQIFIGANRHYPDGFSVLIDDSMVICHNPLKTADFEVYKSNDADNPEDFIWDNDKQQLIVLKWPINQTDIHIRIIPGVFK